MISTPDLSHLKREDYEHVYEPAEDTFILLDALEEDAHELRSLSPAVCLEIGSGSGCVSAFTAKILGPSTTLYLASDINRRACQSTKATGMQNHVSIDPICTFLAEPFRKRLARSVDILLFNPPYVPTYASEAEDAQVGADIAGSWAGGHNGMAITDTLLDQVESLLSPRGRFYLVAVKENDVPGICDRMLAQYGLKGEVVLQRRAGREHLFVLRFLRQYPTI